MSSNLTAPTIFKSAISPLKPPRPPSAADSPLVRLDSILAPLRVADLFPQNLPLEVELGCGDASFIAEYAGHQPEKNFIGVERLLGRLQKLGKKAQRLGLANLRGVRIESAYFLEHLLPKNSAAALHVYFPDPWPKKKHRRHRLIGENFPRLAQSALAARGTVFLRTDDADYFQQMNEVFAAAEFFEKIATPAELLAIKTDFERFFNAQGIPTRHAAFRLRG